MNKNYKYFVMHLNGFCEPSRVQSIPPFSSRKNAQGFLKKHKELADIPNIEYFWIEKAEYPRKNGD